MNSRQGRGRGRGKNSYTFDVKTLLGDDYQIPAHEPEPVGPPDDYLPLPKMPLPLKESVLETLKSNIRQEIVDKCRRDFHISQSTKQSIEKFRNRYREKDPGRATISMLNPKTRDLLLGARLREDGSTSKDKREARESVQQKPQTREEAADNNTEDDETENQPQAERNPETKESEEEDEENPTLEDEELEDEEDAEQITDYISSYFDNGEDYLDDDDDKFEESQAW